jgi:AraC-like DNA-binding protein
VYPLSETIVDYYLDYKNNPSDLGIHIMHSGSGACDPGHCFGYATRDHYLIHYIIEGRGEYRVGKKTYQLKKGDGFLICPGTSTLYKASNEDPWTYKWVGFNGKATKQILASVGLGENRLIFHYDRDDFLDDCLSRLNEACHTASSHDILLIGYLFLFLGKLHEQYESEESRIIANRKSHFDEAVKYIQMNYTQNIKVSDIADYVGIDRSQLYRIFMHNSNISPKQYLTDYRIVRASILINTTDLTFQEISNSVGFEYCSHFYRLFKQHFGMTPSAYKLQH